MYDNELLPQKSWLSQHYGKVAIIISLFIAVFLLLINFGWGDFAQGYAEPSITQNAWAKASTNEDVVKALGTLEPIGKMTLLEGAVQYTNERNTVAITITIKGDKNKGKMDVVAHKVDEIWDYETIIVRIKEPKQSIKVLP